MVVRIKYFCSQERKNMNFVDYINASLEKGTIGSYISVGIFVLIGISAFFGTYYGGARGFSKSIIRLFTVVASAICSLLCVNAISRLIVNSAASGGEGADTVDGLLNAYVPGLVDSMPEMVQPILSEMDAGTATVFVMMILSVIISPILFIVFFYIFKFVVSCYIFISIFMRSKIDNNFIKKIFLYYCFF